MKGLGNDLAINTKTDIDQGTTIYAYEGWFCIETNPFFCEGCKADFNFVHWNQKIVVWEENDCDSILNEAILLKKRDCNPRIIEYKDEFGPAIPFEQVTKGRNE